jgi:DNA-directed RNA polymerase subunit RPC12/RpoP
MKTSYTSGKLTVEFDTTTAVELFEQLGVFQEVFGETKCGKCGSENLRFVVRTDAEENKYYELRCVDCGARLSFGCHKKGGGLFPKRKDAEGNWKPDNGWCKWDKASGKEV